MWNSLLEAVCGMMVAAGIACWLLAVVGKFLVTANRKPGVSRRRAWRWFQEITFGWNVRLDDLVTDTGKWWAKASLLAILGGVLSLSLAAALYTMTHRVSP